MRIDWCAQNRVTLPPLLMSDFNDRRNWNTFVLIGLLPLVVSIVTKLSTITRQKDNFAEFF